ncbi:hypothetical protein [Jannaschia sp. R86511]|uniref:hypothetical protein n=1 Tax=Jannaschia sp. R86511 TaxID=3093853 RepID=UPI0036D3F95B
MSSAVLLAEDPQPAPAGAGPSRHPRSRRRGFVAWVAVLAGLAVVARLPLLGSPPSRDEAGYLMIASQLGPGLSLYGDYWVDRPPLLLAFFAVADRLGGPEGLRALGLLVVATAVVAAAALGWLVAAGRSRPRAGLACGGTAAVFLSTPLFGTAEVNGELIAAPLVLGGAALVLAAVRAPASGPRAALLASAGAAGAAAVLVKQNQWDVVVLVVALLLVGRRSHRVHHLRPRDLGPFTGGFLLAVVAAVTWAARLGTDPRGLWDAVVVFRVQAAAVIGSSASSATSDRLVDLVVAFLLSGAPLLLLLAAVAARRPAAEGAVDLRVPLLAVLAWESFAVLGGASYWPPYLICFTTGLVLAMAVVQTREGSRPRDRWAALLPLGWAAVAAVVALVTVVADPPARPQDAVISWLRANASPGDDAVIAYGHPDILHGAGLASPYPDLWSLPVRARDPRLQELSRLLSGPRAPDWVLLTGSSLATWGIDDRAGTRALREHYVEETVVGRYTVLRLRSDPDE